MNIKTKITLIIGGIIAFLTGWVVLVMSLLENGKNAQTDLIGANMSTGNRFTHYSGSVITTGSVGTGKTIISVKEETKKIPHKFIILTPSYLNKKSDWTKFSKDYNKLTKGSLEIKYYDDIDKYNKDLVYKLAMKKNDFDFAIIPSEWFSDIEYLSRVSFTLNSFSYQLSSLFDYNFFYYLKDNKVRAIPFAIDPIIGYTFDKDIHTKQTFDIWKKDIINSSNRLDKKSKIKYMPILLGYDTKYLNFIYKTKNTILPIFDYISSYYVFKKNRTGISMMKDFGNNMMYKTFSFILYHKSWQKYKKYSFCKGNFMKYCILFGKKTNLVYGFASDFSKIDKNKISIFKKFKKNYKKIKNTTLAISPMDEYPARGWIIIINPNSKNIKYLGTFTKIYTKLGKNKRLPFYKNIISPFLSNDHINNKNIKFMSDYFGRFITLDKLGIGKSLKINKKILNFLKGGISIDILLNGFHK